MNNLYQWAMVKRGSMDDIPEDAVAETHRGAIEAAPQQPPAQPQQQQVSPFEGIQQFLLNFSRGNPNDNQLGDPYGSPTGIHTINANNSWMGSPMVRRWLDNIAVMLGAKDFESLPENIKPWVKFGVYTFAQNFGDKVGWLNSGNLYTNMYQGVLRNRGRGGQGYNPAEATEQARLLTNTAQQLYYDENGDMQNMDPQLYSSWAADYASHANLASRDDYREQLISGSKAITELSQLFGVYNYHDLKEITKTLGYPDIGDPQNAQAVLANLRETQNFSARYGRNMQSVLEEQGTMAQYYKMVTGREPTADMIRQLVAIGARADTNRLKTGQGPTREEAEMEALQDMVGYMDQKGSGLAALMYFNENPNLEVTVKGKGGWPVKRKLTSGERATIGRALAAVKGAKTQHEQRVLLARAYEWARDHGLLRDPYTLRDAAAKHSLQVASWRGHRPDYLQPLA